MTGCLALTIGMAALSGLALRPVLPSDRGTPSANLIGVFLAAEGLSWPAVASAGLLASALFRAVSAAGGAVDVDSARLTGRSARAPACSGVTPFCVACD